MKDNKLVKEKIKARLRVLLPKGFRSYRIMAGSLKGLRLVTSLRDYPSALLGYSERALMKWILSNALQGETWLDVGAHYGVTSLAMIQAVGRGGRVFAFEPNLSTVGCLSRTRTNSNLRQWTICPFALGDSHEMVLLELGSIRGMIDSQLCEEESEGIERLFSVALDSVWPAISCGKDCINGVKIDVQGAELAVLKGMSAILSSQHPVVILEVHAGVCRQEIFDLLMACGYSAKFEAIENDPEDFWDDTGNQSYVFRAEPTAVKR